MVVFGVNRLTRVVRTVGLVIILTLMTIQLIAVTTNFQIAYVASVVLFVPTNFGDKCDREYSNSWSYRTNVRSQAPTSN